MRYLVTGGAGFIGSNTVDELVQRGHGVVVLDDLSGGKEDNLAEIRNKITLIKGSITDIELVRKAMHDAEFVLHLGARTSVPRSVKDPLETNRINVEGTLNVLVAAKEMKVKRVVFAASSSAYGETPTLPKDETMQPEPISPYGVTKYVGELYGTAFLKCYGLETVSLRYEPQVGFEQGLQITFDWYRNSQAKAAAKEAATQEAAEARDPGAKESAAKDVISSRHSSARHLASSAYRPPAHHERLRGRDP